MLDNASVLAIIPARSGSKGLKDKNIKRLNDKPLIGYTIEAAAKSQVFRDVVVSTDSQEYAKIAEQYGASVPFLRPQEISQDDSTSGDVILYTIEQLKKMGKSYEYFMLLQPTSPLRTEQHIIESIELAKEKNANAIVSVCPTNHSKELMMYLEKDRCLDGFLKGIPTSRQKQKISYSLNGAIYLAKTQYYIRYKNFYERGCYAYIMDKYSSVDIDDIYDFKYAETLLQIKHSF